MTQIQNKMLKPTQTILAIGAHADDIELQAGGTLAKYHAHGYKIAYVMSTNNMSGDWATLQADGSITSRKPPLEEIRPQRLKEAEAGAHYFNTSAIHLGYPQKHFVNQKGERVVLTYGCERPESVPQGMPSILTAQEDPKAIQRVADLILEHNPEVILTHGGPMNNVEHFCTLVLVTNAYWLAVEKGFSGMLVQWHDLGVNLYGEAHKHFDTHIDISKFWDQKMEVCALHACQKPDVRRLDWPDNGPMCGCKYAEVFTIIGRSRQAEQYGALTLELIVNER